MAKTTYMLSTKDNPYNPFTEWKDWLLYDVENGWNSCGTLARMAKTSNSLTEEENKEEIERAIDRIIELDPLQMHIKVPSKGGGGPQQN